MAIFRFINRAHRIFTFTENTPGVRPNSVVMVSLTEMRRSTEAGPIDTPFLGDATMKVYNVVPGTDRVTIHGEIDWGSDLDFQISVATF